MTPLSVGTNDVGFISLAYEDSYAAAAPLGDTSDLLLHTSGGSTFRDERERSPGLRIPGHGPREHDTRRKGAGGALTFEVEYDGGQLRAFDMAAGGRAQTGDGPIYDHFLWPEPAKPTAQLFRFLGRHRHPSPGAKIMRQTLSVRDGENLTAEWDFRCARADALTAHSSGALSLSNYTNVKQAHMDALTIGARSYKSKIYDLTITTNENPGGPRYPQGFDGRAEPFRGKQGISTEIRLTVDADADWLSDDGSTGTYKELFIDEATATFRVRWKNVAGDRQFVFFCEATAMVGEPITWSESGEQLAQITLAAEDAVIDFSDAAVFPLLSTNPAPPADVIRPWAMLISNLEDANGFAP